MESIQNMKIDIFKIHNILKKLSQLTLFSLFVILEHGISSDSEKRLDAVTRWENVLHRRIGKSFLLPFIIMVIVALIIFLNVDGVYPELENRSYSDT